MNVIATNLYLTLLKKVILFPHILKMDTMLDVPSKCLQILQPLRIQVK